MTMGMLRWRRRRRDMVLRVMWRSGTIVGLVRMFANTNVVLLPAPPRVSMFPCVHGLDDRSGLDRLHLKFSGDFRGKVDFAKLYEHRVFSRSCFETTDGHSRELLSAGQTTGHMTLDTTRTPALAVVSIQTKHFRLSRS